MAKTTPYQKSEWDTLHNNGPFPLKLLYVTELGGESMFPSKTERYKDAAGEVQRLIRETAEAGEGFRAYGSRWSLSNIAHHRDRMHYNGYMNLHLPLAGEDYHPQTGYDPSDLFFFECGNTIKELSQTLSSHGKSLKTSGASNGQTIAGSVSTGVHGSAIDVGSIQDYVVGLNLIIGPEPDDIIYLERHTRPALSNTFADKIGARVIRNDKLFNAALVGLGGFGFIHGVTIEAEDKFLLRRHVVKVDKDVALELADSMDFRNSEFKIEGETDEEGNPLRPYHYKVFMNPYNDEEEYVVEAIYKKPYEVPYPDPFPVVQKSVYRELIYLFVKIAEDLPNIIPKLIKQLNDVVLPSVDQTTIGTHAELFWDSQYQGPAFACSFGVDHRNSSKAWEVLAKVAREEGPFPGLFAMRFVKQSEAMLAFTKFPITCMIEIDGVLWEKSDKLPSLTEFSRMMIEALQENDIPFTLHWGKNADWGYPNLVNHMYGTDVVNKWKELRSALLSPEMARVFSNDFMDTTGLSSVIDDADEDLIASLDE
ncbi:FAD-linked oxidase [Halalkalibaculum sp. DA3122]|uniref:FAD-linked oxidase n=1 Tax=Halalkalibaculum sp. DA3122 TaxID=3373607 RepID=UPI0037544EAF